jgi:hypothetical protein
MMGAIGAALIAKAKAEKLGKTCFKGFELAESVFLSNSFECQGCSNGCEVVKIQENEEVIGCFGDRCGKWSNKVAV